eukprot:3093918-Prymnesium_polylepis.2
MEAERPEGRRDRVAQVEGRHEEGVERRLTTGRAEARGCGARAAARGRGSARLGVQLPARDQAGRAAAWERLKPHGSTQIAGVGLMAAA